MALTKELVIDQIEILEGGHIQVRRATYILEDGVRIAGPSYHRVAYVPGDDIKGEDPTVQAHARTAWTSDVVNAYHTRMAVEQDNS